MKKFSYLYEIPVFYALILAVNYYLFPIDLGFVDVNPHPFWVGVLIFAFRYGTAAGLFAGLTAAALFLVLMTYFGEPYLFEDISFYFLPGCFVIVGVLLGAGVDRYRDRVAYLLRWRSQLMDRISNLENEIKTQAQVIEGLEKRIVTKMSTLITLYEGARKLENNNIDELYESILDFVAKTLDADEAALYLKVADGWEIKVTSGWQDFQTRPRKIGFHEGITGRAGMSGRIVSVKDILGQKDVDTSHVLELRDSVLSGPIRQGENGDVIGVLSIQSLDFLNFHSATVNLFQFLLGWASRSVRRAAYIKSLRQNEVIDPDLGVYTQNYFFSRATEEFNRSRTYYLPLSVALLRVNGLTGLSVSKRQQILMLISEFLLHTCRSMDVVARLEEKEIDFGLLMITTSRAQALEFRSRILTDFEHLGLAELVSLSIEVASFTPQSENVATLIAEAREELLHVKSA